MADDAQTLDERRMHPCARRPVRIPCVGSSNDALNHVLRVRLPCVGSDGQTGPGGGLAKCCFEYNGWMAFTKQIK